MIAMLRMPELKKDSSQKVTSTLLDRRCNCHAGGAANASFVGLSNPAGNERMR
jgi:hypothetical protein